MTAKAKTCSKCGISKPLNEFHNHKKMKDGKYSQCKECANEQKRKWHREHPEIKNKIDRKYREEHREERKEYDKIRYKTHKEEMDKKSKVYYEEHKDEIRQRVGKLPMSENKLCSSYLGVFIGERLCRHLFKDVEVMPYGNTGFDIICNHGKKIDVKIASKTFSDKNNKYPRWIFHIDLNTTADFFILVAFDNRTDLNPLHIWMIPGNEINKKGNASIALSRIHKWDKWKRDINDAQLCCTEMKFHK